MDEGMRLAWPELPMSAADWRSLEAAPSGVFLTRQAAARRAVTIGETITLNTSPGSRADGTGTWPFTVLGFIDDPPGWSQNWDSDMIVGNLRYFRNAGRLDERNIVSTFRVAIDRPEHASAVCQEMRRWFTNATPALNCVPARENSVQQQDASVNMRQISLGIGTAGLFMILFLCANGTAESIRERLPQFGVLKAIGFGNGAIATMVILEAAVPTLLAALLGSAAAPAADLLLSRLASEGVIDVPEMKATLLAPALALMAGLLIALVSAATPLLRLLRTDGVSMMAKR
jgi:putative ABC transport system permease protein